MTEEEQTLVLEVAKNVATLAQQLHELSKAVLRLAEEVGEIHCRLGETTK